MKKVAGTLKIEQAQYYELESFSKFSSDVDKITAMALDKGRKNTRLLIQSQYSPMPVGEQIAILYCGTHSLMAPISIDQVSEFQNMFLTKMRAEHADVLASLASGDLTEHDVAEIESTADLVCKSLTL